MNLPTLSPLQNNQSTYIAFSKALLDFDRAVSTNTACYFSKMIALRLPDWKDSVIPEEKFYIDLSSVGVESDSPNICIPKTLQYYMENIMRFPIGVNESDIPQVAEIAFWKSLEKMGMTGLNIRNCVTFANSIITSNFIKTENNNGWMEIVCQIPNKSKVLTKAWKELDGIADLVQGVSINGELALYDNGLNQFEFGSDMKQILDFANFQYDDVTESTFDFNTLLLFYKDSDGVDKLHGINFIYPFENKVTFWDQSTFTQKTNDARTIGYQFKFNMKSCVNEATQMLVYQENDHSFYNVFGETLTGLNSFLELKMRENVIQ